MNTAAHEHTRTGFLASDRSEGFIRVFTWYTRRLFAKKFAAVRLCQESEPIARSLSSHAGPAIVVMNHCSWWDPLVAVLLSSTFTPDRRGCGPMDLSQLQKFRFFRKLGVFGVNPDEARSIVPMLAHVEALIAAHPATTLWITPQGRFCDIRTEIAIKPGAAALAARLGPSCRVFSLAIEYGFWTDAKPEVFLRFTEIPTPATAPGSSPTPPTARAWTDAMQQAMTANAESLAGRVIARDPSAFTIISGGTARINPAYDWWLKLRGKRVEIDANRTHHGASVPVPKAKTTT